MEPREPKLPTPVFGSLWILSLLLIVNNVFLLFPCCIPVGLIMPTDDSNPQFFAAELQGTTVIGSVLHFLEPKLQDDSGPLFEF